MYSVDAYGRMITDEPRTQAYVSALRQTVKHGSVVVDIGTGPGFFALLACKLGARRVYAIEPDNVIQLARDCARLNGVSERIEFIQDLSTNVTLSEPADVVVTDLRGVLPLYGTNLPSLQDAHNRFLATDGILIPARDHLFAALSHAPETYEKLAAPWGIREGISLAPARTVVMNTWSKHRVEKAGLLSEPVTWHSIDYSEIKSFDARSEMILTVTQAGTAHGVAVWFDSDLCEGISFSNSPGEPELIYGNAFLPLSQPIEVNIGDEVHFRIRADLIKSEYIWSWETRVYDRQRPDIVKTHFRQSTFSGAPLSQSQLRKRASSYTPILTDEARISSFILSQMDGLTTVEQLAQKVVEEFPQRFASSNDALDVVAEVSAKYSK